MRDYPRYIWAVDDYEHKDMLEVLDIDCWGGKDKDMGSLYCSNKLNDLSDFWDLFDKYNKREA
jgi:hypothetical protein